MKHGTIGCYTKKKCRCDECRQASATYRRKYRKSRPDLEAKYAIARRLYFERVRDFVRSQKHNKPCTDCAVSYPYYVMQFDHRGEEAKSFNVSQVPTIAKAKKEISKCDLVCANCHFIRTHNRRLTLLSKKMTL